MSSRLRPRTPEVSREVNRANVSDAGRQGAHVVEMQRRRLLSALVEIVAEEGLEGASVGRICKRAGVSRRTFYEIFVDREACLLMAFDQAVQRILEILLPEYRCERKWSTRIRACLAALLEHLDSEPGLARLCVVETLRAGPEVSESRKRMFDALTAVVDEGRIQSKQGSALTPLTAQGVVGGALSVIHAGLLEDAQRPLIELLNQLMGMIVQPYLGSAAACRELDRPMPETSTAAAAAGKDPFKDLGIRFTYRTALVLSTIASDPAASNRHIAEVSGVLDEGQMSRLLRRLQQAGLIENEGEGQPKGEPNAWTLTQRGQAVHSALK